MASFPKDAQSLEQRAIRRRSLTTPRIFCLQCQARRCRGTRTTSPGIQGIRDTTLSENNKENTRHTDEWCLATVWEKVRPERRHTSAAQWPPRHCRLPCPLGKCPKADKSWEAMKALQDPVLTLTRKAMRVTVTALQTTHTKVQKTSTHHKYPHISSHLSTKCLIHLRVLCGSRPRQQTRR